MKVYDVQLVVTQRIHNRRGSKRALAAALDIIKRQGFTVTETLSIEEVPERRHVWVDGGAGNPSQCAECKQWDDGRARDLVCRGAA